MRFRRVACRPRLRPRFPAGIMPHGGKGFGTIRRLYARGHLHHLRNRQLRPLLRRPAAAVLGPSSLPAAMVLSVLLDAHRSCGAAAGKLPRTGRRRLAPRGSGAAFRAEPRGGRPPCWEALPDEPVYPLRRRRPRSRASATPASLKYGRTEPAFRPAVAQSAKLATPAAPRGASRQACHAGGRAGRATHAPAVRVTQMPSAAKTGGVARKTARSTSRHRRSPWSMPPGLPCRRSRRQSHTHATCTELPDAIRRQDWRRGPQDCALHPKAPPLPVEQAARLAMPAVAPAEQHTPQQSGLPKCHPPPRLAAWPARLRAPPQAAAPRGASRQACHAGGRAGRATHTPAVRVTQMPPAAKTGGVARKTACSTSSRRPLLNPVACRGGPACPPPAG